MKTTKAELKRELATKKHYFLGSVFRWVALDEVELAVEDFYKGIDRGELCSIRECTQEFSHALQFTGGSMLYIGGANQTIEKIQNDRGVVYVVTTEYDDSYDGGKDYNTMVYVVDNDINK